MPSDGLTGMGARAGSEPGRRRTNTCMHIMIDIGNDLSHIKNKRDSKNKSVAECETPSNRLTNGRRVRQIRPR